MGNPIFSPWDNKTSDGTDKMTSKDTRKIVQDMESWVTEEEASIEAGWADLQAQRDKADRFEDSLRARQAQLQKGREFCQMYEGASVGNGLIVLRGAKDIARELKEILQALPEPATFAHLWNLLNAQGFTCSGSNPRGTFSAQLSNLTKAGVLKALDTNPKTYLLASSEDAQGGEDAPPEQPLSEDEKAMMM